MVLFLLLAGFGELNNAWATNGYFSHGIGTRNKAMAGAGIALPEDAISVVNNPAVAVLVGNQMVAGIAFYMPDQNYRTYESDKNGRFGSLTIGPNEIDSDKDFFVVPHFAWTRQLSDKSAFAIALYDRGGIHTRFVGGTATFDSRGLGQGMGPGPVTTSEGTFGDGNTLFDLKQVLVDASYARQLTERLSLGAGAVLALQSLEVRGMGTFAPYTETYAASGGSIAPPSLSGNGRDQSFGAGIKVGLHWQWTESFGLGISYQSKIMMSDLDDYADLLPKKGNMDIPANFKFGMTWQPVMSLAISLDAEHTWYSDVAMLGNSLNNLLECPTFKPDGNDLSSCLGGNNGSGFGWDDVTTYKIGLQWRQNARWTWRAGASESHQPIRDSDLAWNIVNPNTTEVHVTFGFTRSFSRPGGQTGDLNVALMYSEEDSIRGPNLFDGSQDVELTRSEWEFEVSYGWQF
jgi:long-chain fatty acid transport protein